MLFLSQAEILALHQRTIREHGGLDGIRDENGLESAMLAPQMRHYYEEADLAQCAATYAFHLSQAHPFIDGNKRIAAVAAETFLILNGARLTASNDELYDFYLKIAAGELSRDEAEEMMRRWIGSTLPLG